MKAPRSAVAGGRDRPRPARRLPMRRAASSPSSATTARRCAGSRARPASTLRSSCASTARRTRSSERSWPCRPGRGRDGRSGRRTEGDRRPPPGRGRSSGMLEDPRSRSVVLGRISSAVLASRRRRARPGDRDARPRQTRRGPDRRRARDRVPSSSARRSSGLALARYIVRVEPLASMPAAEVIDYIAPTFQHYLVGTLKADRAPRSWNVGRRCRRPTYPHALERT